jgi:aspartate/methionine/tyrosine aminotransferase
MFSQRTSWNRKTNRLVERVAGMAGAEAGLVDLSCSNPTACGLTYNPDVFAGLADAASARYAPEPMGLRTAREAVGLYYKGRGRTVHPDHTWLAAGTSELYAQLMWLLCDPGDRVLVPRPGYPLYDFLGDLAGVERVPYTLRYDGQWHIDMAELAGTIETTAGVRALVVVSPNNPTGNYLKQGEWSVLDALCAQRDIALVIDEVFHDYPLNQRAVEAWETVDHPAALHFILSGLSKVAALPQLKLSWAAAAGPARRVDEALARLEVMADTFLSVSTPVQLALPRLLSGAEEMQRRIRERCAGNLARLRDWSKGTCVTVLDCEGGWTALVRLPELKDLDDVAWAHRFLDVGVVVQPGYLFDLGSALTSPCVAVSLLTPPELLANGLSRLAGLLDAETGAPN